MRSRRTLRLLALLLALGALAVLAWARLGAVSIVGGVLLAGGLIALLLWGAWRLYQAALWKVGRRLAFSYFLIGVLPIPMVAFLLGLATYILAGYFLGHLYRDALAGVDAELQTSAAHRLAPAQGDVTGTAGGRIVTALYRNGRRLGDEPRLPAAWPAWLTATPAAEVHWVLFGDHPTLAVAQGDATAGSVAVWDGTLGPVLSDRTDVWVEVYGPAKTGTREPVNLEVMGRDVNIKVDPQRSAVEAEHFFASRRVSQPDDDWLARQWDRPFLWWGEVPGPLHDLASGEPVADKFAVALNAPPRSLRRHLFSGSAEVDVEVWTSLLVLAFLLFDVYLAAAVLAGVMIFTLSRAVNRLSRATEAVREGDFTVRIPVRRRDQVGELQRSFNLMAENLEQLVTTATQKELLEKELAIARDLQQSLIPSDLPGVEGVELATVFEPSAAIGGDYFDILRLGEDRLAVIVADVSGHGLPTGLRMAMLKAALTILVSEQSDPDHILRKLDTVVRLDREGRFFVTATLALLDFRTGRLELTNAGHPPTYILSADGVREVLLPSSPLGGLGQTYGRETVQLASGDVVVWLSDGFIESTDARDEPFGYHGVIRTLEEVASGGAGDREAGAGVDGEGGGEGSGERGGEQGGEGAATRRGPTAAEVRNRMVAAVARHTGGRHPEDDRTLVVLRSTF